MVFPTGDKVNSNLYRTAQYLKIWNGPQMIPSVDGKWSPLSTANYPHSRPITVLLLLAICSPFYQALMFRCCPGRTLSRKLIFCLNAAEYGNMRSGINCGTVQTYCKCTNYNPRTSKSVSLTEVKIGAAIICPCTCMTRMEYFCLREVSVIGDSTVRLFQHNFISFKLLAL